MALSVFRRVLRDPGLLPEVLSKLQARIGDARHRRRVSSYSGLVVAPVDGLARILEVPATTVQQVMEAPPLREFLDELNAYEIPPQARAMGGAAFLEACYAAVRLTRPKVVVETGVALGYSTAVILHALAANGEGRLYSVDLPMLKLDVATHTGAAVPTRLRSSGNWELLLGSDRRVLPRLLDRIGPVDLCFYDSDKSYGGMLRTATLVWSHMRPGAILMVDDVHAHDAYLDFADAQGIAPTIISKPTRRGVYRWDRVYYVGLGRKPEPSRR